VRTRTRGLTLLVTLGACSVFPDRAVLPGGEGGAGADAGASGATMGGAQSGFAGALPSGSAGLGGEAGAPSLGGSTAGGAVGGDGAGGDAAGGSGGAAGETGIEPPCDDATELRLPAVADAWLSGEAGQTSANFGDAPTLAVASTEGSEARAVVAFDLLEVPAGANVGRASLELGLRTSIGETRTLGAYAVTREWRETKASWVDATPSTDWSRPGGDSATVPSDTRLLVLGTAAGVRVAWDVSEDVRLDVAAGAPGFGWLVRDAGAPGARIEFASSEAADLAARPELVILLCP